jgi:molecular chaperone DnaJ
VVVRVEDHDFYRRDGTSLVCEIPISLAQAALGASLEVPTLEGGQAKLQVPEGTQPGATFRIRGHGVPHLGARDRGDLHVVVRVVVPNRLTGEQRKLLQQLSRGGRSRSSRSRVSRGASPGRPVKPTG